MPHFSRAATQETRGNLNQRITLDFKGDKNIKRYVAELVGTFVLVFASCGSAVLAGDKIGFLGVSLAFGLSARNGLITTRTQL